MVGKRLSSVLAAVLSVALIASCDKNNGEEGGEVEKKVLVEGVTLTPESLSMLEGERAELAFQVIPENADNKNVTWDSSDSTVATVRNGTVTAVSAGEATITVITEDGRKEARCDVSVASIIPVTDLKLSHSGMILKVGDSFKVIPTVLPENATDKAVVFTSENENVATVTEDGLTTAVSEGSTRIKVKAVGGAIERYCSVVVSSGACRCNMDVPGWGEDVGDVRFATDQTWIVGNQEWSDAVVLVNGMKETFEGGTMDAGFNADARSNPDYKGTLFSWCAVFRYRDNLCPEGWRVPTSDDFVALDIALGGTGLNKLSGTGRHLNEYVSRWGAEFQGYCGIHGNVLAHNTDALYWSLTENSDKEAYYLGLKRSLYVGPLSHFDKGCGYSLRCVRDI